jgi:ribonuclease P/MRP protein subunit POP3
MRAAVGASHEQQGTHANEPNQEVSSTPPIISHIKVGINEVTKVLETEVQSSRQTVVKLGTAVSETHALMSVIFICYTDLDTPALVAHLPQLVALCNSTRPEDHKIKVVQLPVEAQSSLADALGYLKRISVMAVDVCHLGFYHDY